MKRYLFSAFLTAAVAALPLFAACDEKTPSAATSGKTCSHGTATASASGQKSCAKTCASKQASGCSHASAAQGTPSCPAEFAACLDKKISQDKKGNLVCPISGTVYATARKNHGKTVYTVGSEEFDCRYKATMAALAQQHKDKNFLDPASLPRDEKGNLMCKCCGMPVATAVVSENGTSYTVGGKNFDCAIEAYLAAAKGCENKCMKKAGSQAKTSGCGMGKAKNV
jgi:hypothetical protein